MGKKIIFIHGRSTKPKKDVLQELWFRAVRSGLKRDYGDTGVQRFEEIEKELVYYFDITQEKIPGWEFESEVDIQHRFDSLKKLESYGKNDFNEEEYDKLHTFGAVKEAAADIFSDVLSFFGLGKRLIKRVAKDMGEYWNEESYYSSDVRYKMTMILQDAILNKDDILIVGHSLGTIITYDTLWKFSHYSEYRNMDGMDHKIDKFISLGSPLADENVKSMLKGRNSKGKFKYPLNLRSWVNISAEDDYVCSDEEVANDFDYMTDHDLIDKIKDIPEIYNLTVKNGVSNPHSSIGYLIHPAFISELYNWM